jgi:pantetheine-phosphate adenylyltransferase
MKLTGMFNGSFDPIHKGHVAALKIAAQECDNLIVLVSQNKAKKPMIPLDVRKNHVEDSLFKAGIKNFSVVTTNSYSTDVMMRFRPDIWFKGIRNGDDRKLEESTFKAMCEEMDSFYPGFKNPELFLIESEKEFLRFSSSKIKTLISYGHSILDMVAIEKIADWIYKNVYNLKVINGKRTTPGKTVEESILITSSDVMHISSKKVLDKIASSKAPGVIKDRDEAINIFSLETGDYSSLEEIMNFSVPNENVAKAQLIIARHVEAEMHTMMRQAMEDRLTSVVIDIPFAKSCNIKQFIRG